MTDLDIEAIKGLDLSGFFNGLLREWYEGYQPCDGTLLVECLRNAGVNVDTLVAEVERLRAALGLIASCEVRVPDTVVSIAAAALHPQEPSDAT
jgi:hypothetical protein